MGALSAGYILAAADMSEVEFVGVAVLEDTAVAVLEDTAVAAAAVVTGRAELY